MLNPAYLFIDFEKHPADERADMQVRMQACLISHELHIINFFTSIVEELLIVSKHRVVSLPTFVALGDNKKPIARLTKIPSEKTLRDLLGDGN